MWACPTSSPCRTRSTRARRGPLLMGISTKVEISGARECVVELVGLEPATRLLVRPAPQNGAPLNLGLVSTTRMESLFLVFLANTLTPADAFSLAGEAKLIHLTPHLPPCFCHDNNWCIIRKAARPGRAALRDKQATNAAFLIYGFSNRIAFQFAQL